MKKLFNKIGNILMFLIKLYTGYFIFYGLFMLFAFLIKRKKPVKYPIIYSKELPFHLNQKSLYRIRLAAQFFFTVLSTGVIIFILLNDFAPFGETEQYALGQENSVISEIGPKNRVKVDNVFGKQLIKQTHDLVYFTTNTPQYFDTATVKITFQNPYPDQTISLGFQDQEKWHYASKLIDAPVLDNLPWHKVGNDPVLYEQNPKYKTINEFFNNIPKDEIIGTFDYDANFANTSHTYFPDYKPQKTQTIINTPLRGTHILYAYLQNEPFYMAIQKQDLNWYEDPDTMTVKIYKDSQLLYQTTSDDDGITNNSRKTMPPEDIVIKNPSNIVPENGVYKIEIDANTDTIIKQIKTNLHKIVVADSIFPVNNASIYNTIVASTSATLVYTNALMLSAITYHNKGEQDIQVNNQILHVDTPNLEQKIIPNSPKSKVIIPNNDIILKGAMGYFAFSQDSFFVPIEYHIVPITSQDDIQLVDYILTNYNPTKKEGDWQVAENTFNIRDAYIKNGKLSWVIQAPRIKNNNREITIKDLVITFSKKSWF